MANDTNYNLIYNKIINLRCSPHQINIIKDRYKNEVNSPRQLEFIKNLSDLLVILDKRDSLNIDTLEEISLYMEKQDIINLIKQYKLSNIPVSIPNEPQIQVLKVLPRESTNIKQIVFNTISKKIGLKWTDFARELDISEGEIQELKEKHNNRISECVYEVLNYHEETCDKRKWRTELLNALHKARRRDLMLKIQDIFDINNS